MKKLSIITAFVFMLFTKLAQAQDYNAMGLTYTQSTNTPLANAIFGLSVDGGDYSSKTCTIYLNLPSSVIGHVAYASVRTQGVNNNYGDVTVHNETGNSSATFTVFSSDGPVYLEWAIDYDDGSWQTLSGYASAGNFYSFEVPH